MYDIIIIGAGPAGLTAGIYAKQANKKVLILEKEIYGGQILKANSIKNYPGFSEISGYEFANKLYTQVKELDIEIKTEEVLKVNLNDKEKEIITNKGNYLSKSIIIASGGQGKKLNLPNEDNLLGKGLSYCATCDGAFFKNKIVAVYGGGNSAISSTIYLSNICKKVYLIYRQKDFRVENSEIENLKNKENIELLFNTKIIELIGKEQLSSVKLIEDNTEYNLDVDGLFIEIGYVPVSDMCKNIIDTDEKGYIIADETCKTNVEGIFVAGDIRIKEIRQLTTACSDGTVAAINACKYINKKNTN